jgi:ferredoxin
VHTRIIGRFGPGIKGEEQGLARRAPPSHHAGSLGGRDVPPILFAISRESRAMGLTKVWVEDGCILCNLCPEVAPEVFVLEDEHCWARPDADLDENEEEIRQAVIDCPVGVIHFEED